jgi:hypothetical protein
VFPARYELNSYIVFRKRLVSKRLSERRVRFLLLVPISETFLWFSYDLANKRLFAQRLCRLCLNQEQRLMLQQRKYVVGLVAAFLFGSVLVKDRFLYSERTIERGLE